MLCQEQNNGVTSGDFLPNFASPPRLGTFGYQAPRASLSEQKIADILPSFKRRQSTREVLFLYKFRKISCSFAAYLLHYLLQLGL